MEATVHPPVRYARSGSDLLKEIRQPVLTGLSRALRRALAGAIDELLDRLLREREWEARQAVEDGLDLLRNGREGIEIRFDRACSESWERRTRRRGAASAADAGEAGGTGGMADAGKAAAPAKPVLSLIDDNAIGEQLQVGRIAGRSRRRMDEEQVDGMRARFGAMLGQEWFADNEYPIAPDVVFESLRETLAEFGPARTVFFLLEVFEPKVSADLATIYADLNQRLIALGVLPEIRYQIAKTGTPRSGGASGPGNAPAPGGAPDPAGAAMGMGGDAAPSAFQNGAFPAGPPGMAMMPGQAGGADAAPMPGPSGPPGTAAAAAGFDSYEQACFYSTIPPAMPALGERLRGETADGAALMMSPSAVIELADRLVQRIPAAQGSATRYLSDPERFGSPDAAARAAPATEKLLDVLTVLQSTAPGEGETVAEMVSAARSRSTDAAREHGSPLERLIIETVSLIFEQVYEDEEIADAIKPQLLRLQVAAFKAALIDPSFFARPEHPMRQVIERLSAIGADPDYETLADSPLTTDIADLVSWILATFERDLALFEEALERIDRIVEAETARRDERLARIAAAAEKAERHEAVRRGVRETLLRDVRPDVPEFVRRMLSEPWSEVIARIRGGGGHPPFDEKRAERTASLLLWSISPKVPADVPKLAAVLPQLIADLSRGLAFVSLAETDRELFFSELLALHGATIDDAKRRRPAAARPPEAPAGAALEPPIGHEPAHDEPAPGLPADDEPETQPMPVPASPPETDAAAAAGPDSDAVAALRLLNGSEVMITDPDGETRRFKLGWMSPARTVFIFSRYPREHRTIRRQDLNRLIVESHFRVLTRTPVVGAVIDTLKSR